MIDQRKHDRSPISAQRSHVPPIPDKASQATNMVKIVYNKHQSPTKGGVVDSKMSEITAHTYMLYDKFN